MTKEVTIIQEPVTSMEIVQYNEKTLLLKGNTKPYKEELKKMRARWSYALGGWIWPSSKREELEAFVEHHTDKHVRQLLLF